MTVLIQDAREAVCQRFVSSWTETPIVFDNEDPSSVDAGSAPWIRVSFREVSGGQETLGAVGGRKYRRRAVVSAQIFVPTNTGKRRAGEIVSALRALLEGVTFSSLDFDDADPPREIGPGPEGRWDMTVVEINLAYEEVK